MSSKPAPVIDLSHVRHRGGKLVCPSCKRTAETLYIKNGQPVCYGCLQAKE